MHDKKGKDELIDRETGFPHKSPERGVLSQSTKTLGWICQSILLGVQVVVSNKRTGLLSHLHDCMTASRTVLGKMKKRFGTRGVFKVYIFFLK